MASLIADLVISWKTTRLTSLSLSPLFWLSSSRTCQEIASPSRSGSVARKSWSEFLRAWAMARSCLWESGETSQFIAKSSSGRTEPSLEGRSRTWP
jgi:hypothetical protein